MLKKQPIIVLIIIALCFSCRISPMIIDGNRLNVQQNYDRDYLLIYLASEPIVNESRKLDFGKVGFDTLYIDCYLVENYVTRKTNKQYQSMQMSLMKDGLVKIDTTKFEPFSMRNNIIKVAFVVDENNDIKIIRQCYQGGKLVLINKLYDDQKGNYVVSKFYSFNNSILESNFLEPAQFYKCLSSL